VARTACVDLPAFPLQLLLRGRPEWREHPAAVVDEDRPQGIVLWANERARARRVLPGMRYAAALALACDLRAATVPDREVGAAVLHLARVLRRYTPNVEPAAEEPGTLWLDASGLERLYPSLREWGDRIRSDLEREGFEAAVAVGFSRFGTYALARGKRGVVVLDSAEAERRAARAVPLDRLAIPPEAREALAKLGVADVGAFLRLPAEGLARRFGHEVYRLHRLGSGDLIVPLQPDRPEPPALEREALDHAETDVARLLGIVERRLAPLAERAAARGRAIAELRLGLRFDRLGDHVETLRPAEPTADPAALLELARLRLEAVRRLPDGVVEVVLIASEVVAPHRQRALAELAARRRDLEAARRALARVRAALGDAAVVRAALRDGHLPEAGFAWEPLAELGEAHPRPAPEIARAVRRIHERPVPLPPRPRHEPDGWMLRGLEQGPVVRVDGPYVVAGGWWNRAVHREYHFAETRQGELLWLYYDRPRRRWFLQGRIE